MAKENSQTGDDCVQYYCVYWYPTIFHKHRTSKTHQIPERFIDDKSLLYRLSLSVSENETNGDLTFMLRFYDGNKTDIGEQNKSLRDIEVKYTACHKLPHDCFVTYSYQREKLVADVKDVLKYFYNKAIDQDDTAIVVSDEKANEFIDRVFLNFYHLAKGLYHEHEVQKESDGRLHAYFFNEKENTYVKQEPDIDKRNHEAIICYLDQYEQLFATYAQQVSTLYKQFKKHVNSYSKVIRPEELDKSNKDVLVESLLKLRYEKYLQDKVNEPAVEDNSDAPLSVEDIKKKMDEDAKKEQENKQWVIKERSNIAQNSCENIKKEIQNHYNDITSSLVSELNTMLKLCGDALTEYNYCKTLLESRYNSDYGYGILFDSCEGIQANIQGKSHEQLPTILESNELKVAHRKKAFNIDNSVRYIEEIRHKGDVWENQLLQDSIIRINHLTILNQELLNGIQTLSETNKELISQTNVVSGYNKKMLNEAKKSDRRAMWVAIVFGIVGVASLAASIISIYKCL